MRSSLANLCFPRGLCWVIFLAGSLALCIAVLAGCGKFSSPLNIATVTTLSVSPATVAVGASVTLTATVTEASNSQVSEVGTVTFYDGSTALGTAGLTFESGATLSTSFTTTGSHSITASFPGASGFGEAASASPAVVVTVTANSVTTTPSGGLAAGGASTIYVVEQTVGGGSILAFPVTATGSATPSSTLSTPAGTTVETVATDSSGQIYVGVVNASSQAEVLVYAAGASGAATPVRTILGNLTTGVNTTTFTQPISMVVSVSGVLYVLSDSTTSSVAPYSVTALSATANGAATPIAYIAGSLTQMTGALSIAVDAASNIYVSGLTAGTYLGYGGAIEVFASGANGNAAPARVITGGQVFYGVAVDSNLNVYAVEDYSSLTTAGSIVEFTAGASGAATPMKTIAGSSTGFFFGGAIKIDNANNLYVVNVVNPMTSPVQSVLAFPPAASGNVAPALNFTSTAWSTGGSEIAVH